MGLIDTAAFIEKVKLAEKAGEETKGIYTTVDYLINEYGELVEAEPVRHGRWITNFETDEGRSLRCSKCRMVFWVGHGRDGNYCPNCGAKMDINGDDDNE